MTRTQVIQFRVSSEERAEMDRLAARAGVKLSDWIRSRALEEALSTGTVAGEDARVSPDRLAAPPRAPEKRVPAIAGLRPARQYVKPFVPCPKGS